jgi:DUF971 family protein
MPNHPLPTEILLHQLSRSLEIGFDDGARFQLPAELLRVYSPSAQVRGHAPGQWLLQLGKQQVGIRDLQPVGRYAVKISFDDGHDSGLFDWRYLYQLGQHQAALWDLYQECLSRAGERTNWPDPFETLQERGQLG